MSDSRTGLGCRGQEHFNRPSWCKCKMYFGLGHRRGAAAFPAIMMRCCGALSPRPAYLNRRHSATAAILWGHVFACVSAASDVFWGPSCNPGHSVDLGLPTP